MTKKPTTLPKGYRAVTSSLAVSDVTAAIPFYETAFSATVLNTDNADAPLFAALKIGNAQVFLTAGWAQGGYVPLPVGAPRATSQHMYLEDVDASFANAVEAGATPVSEPTDMYWGERTAIICDPFGHYWTLATRTEILTADMLEAKRKEALGLNDNDVAPVVVPETTAAEEAAEVPKADA